MGGALRDGVAVHIVTEPRRCLEIAEPGTFSREEIADAYRKYRGRCKELCDSACRSDPTLTLVRGHYFCPIWNSDEPHWWTVRRDGTIYDPSRAQFPSRGLGVYTPFDGMVSCAECGVEISEDEARHESNFSFCSGRCFGRFVGVIN